MFFFYIVALLISIVGCALESRVTIPLNKYNAGSLALLMSVHFTVRVSTHIIDNKLSLSDALKNALSFSSPPLSAKDVSIKPPQKVNGPLLTGTFPSNQLTQTPMPGGRKHAPETATVLQDGILVSVEPQTVVPGDILFLSVGDVVPADARLLPVSAIAEGNGGLLPSRMQPRVDLYPLPAAKGILPTKVTVTADVRLVPMDVERAAFPHNYYSSPGPSGSPCSLALAKIVIRGATGVRCCSPKHSLLAGFQLWDIDRPVTARRAAPSARGAGAGSGAGSGSGSGSHTSEGVFALVVGTGPNLVLNQYLNAHTISGAKRTSSKDQTVEDQTPQISGGSGNGSGKTESGSGSGSFNRNSFDRLLSMDVVLYKVCVPVILVSAVMLIPVPHFPRWWSMGRPKGYLDPLRGNSVAEWIDYIMYTIGPVLTANLALAFVCLANLGTSSILIRPVIASARRYASLLRRRGINAETVGSLESLGFASTIVADETALFTDTCGIHSLTVGSPGSPSMTLYHPDELRALTAVVASCQVWPSRPASSPAPTRTGQGLPLIRALAALTLTPREEAALGRNLPDVEVVHLDAGVVGDTPRGATPPRWPGSPQTSLLSTEGPNMLNTSRHEDAPDLDPYFTLDYSDLVPSRFALPCTTRHLPPLASAPLRGLVARGTEANNKIFMCRGPAGALLRFCGAVVAGAAGQGCTTAEVFTPRVEALNERHRRSIMAHDKTTRSEAITVQHFAFLCQEDVPSWCDMPRSEVSSSDHDQPLGGVQTAGDLFPVLFTNGGTVDDAAGRHSLFSTLQHSPLIYAGSIAFSATPSPVARALLGLPDPQPEGWRASRRLSSGDRDLESEHVIPRLVRQGLSLAILSNRAAGESSALLHALGLDNARKRESARTLQPLIIPPSPSCIHKDFGSSDTSSESTDGVVTPKLALIGLNGPPSSIGITSRTIGLHSSLGGLKSAYSRSQLVQRRPAHRMRCEVLDATTISPADVSRYLSSTPATVHPSASGPTEPEPTSIGHGTIGPNTPLLSGFEHSMLHVDAYTGHSQPLRRPSSSGTHAHAHLRGDAHKASTHTPPLLFVSRADKVWTELVKHFTAQNQRLMILTSRLDDTMSTAVLKPTSIPVDPKTRRENPDLLVAIVDSSPTSKGPQIMISKGLVDQLKAVPMPVSFVTVKGRRCGERLLDTLLEVPFYLVSLSWTCHGTVRTRVLAAMVPLILCFAFLVLATLPGSNSDVGYSSNGLSTFDGPGILFPLFYPPVGVGIVGLITMLYLDWIMPNLVRVLPSSSGGPQRPRRWKTFHGKRDTALSLFAFGRELDTLTSPNTIIWYLLGQAVLAIIALLPARHWIFFYDSFPDTFTTRLSNSTMVTIYSSTLRISPFLTVHLAISAAWSVCAAIIHVARVSLTNLWGIADKRGALRRTLPLTTTAILSLLFCFLPSQFSDLSLMLLGFDVRMVPSDFWNDLGVCLITSVSVCLLSHSIDIWRIKRRKRTEQQTQMQTTPSMSSRSRRRRSRRETELPDYS